MTNVRDESRPLAGPLARPPTVVAEFIIHLVTGAFLFIALAFCALAIDWTATYLTSNQYPAITAVISALKYLILVLDILLFVIFLVRAMVRAFARLTTGAQDE